MVHLQTLILLHKISIYIIHYRNKFLNQQKINYVVHDSNKNNSIDLFIDKRLIIWLNKSWNIPVAK